MRRVSDFLVAVVVVHVVLLGGFAHAAEATLIRGDANRDGRVSIADAAGTLLYLCLAGGEPACLAAADTNASGTLDLNDPLRIMRVLYLGEDTIAVPFPGCSTETLGELTCETPLGCGESVPPVPGPHRIAVIRSGGDTEATVRGTPGNELDVPIEVVLETLDGVTIGAYAWSFGLRVESESIEASLVEPTFSGTRAADTFTGGFRHVAAVEGGAVSEIILNITSPDTLPPGSSTVLKATLRVAVDPTGMEGTVTVSPSPMNGPGGRVELEVLGGDAEGSRLAPFEPSIAPLTIRVVPARFARGNSNLDGAYDISDAMHILLALFEHPDGFPCADASDANDDGAVDLSDAVFTLGCLFLGDSCPAAPHPDCGLDASPDDLGCVAAPSSCD